VFLKRLNTRQQLYITKNLYTPNWTGSIQDPSSIYSVDNANLERIGDAIYDDDILSLELAKWRSKGPMGKLHNLVLWIRRSALHRERRQEKQKELGFKDKKQLIQDNSTRNLLAFGQQR
jgi:uncharacterized protein YhdP